MNTADLYKTNPGAYDALPESYQADDCLIFWERNGKLFVRPRRKDRHAIGDWVAEYIPGEFSSGEYVLFMEIISGGNGG